MSRLCSIPRRISITWKSTRTLKLICLDLRQNTGPLYHQLWVRIPSHIYGSTNIHHLGLWHSSSYEALRRCDQTRVRLSSWIKTQGTDFEASLFTKPCPVPWLDIFSFPYHWVLLEVPSTWITHDIDGRYRRQLVPRFCNCTLFSQCLWSSHDVSNGGYRDACPKVRQCARRWSRWWGVPGYL